MKKEEAGGVSEVKKKRKRKEIAVYGNYRSYYGYRINHELEEDPRMKVLKKEWFEGKDCLDIGCNSGLITITIAKKFNCRSMLGIDIDHDRVEDAFWQLKKIVRMDSAKKMSLKPCKSTVSERENGVEDSTNAPLNEKDEEKRGKLRDCSASKERDLFDIVSFQQENFVQSRNPSPNTHYDTVLCLSVTKWIHLNWGDDGLITLFSKVWRILQPGGIFVLEPQPWDSYYKNRLVSETTAMNYRSIKLHPDCFQEILLDKIGFRMVEDISSKLTDSKTGFNRPMLAFYK